VTVCHAHVHAARHVPQVYVSPLIWSGWIEVFLLPLATLRSISPSANSRLRGSPDTVRWYRREDGAWKVIHRHGDGLMTVEIDPEGGGSSPRQAADDMSATARKRTTFG
jgi:hypothetical protein